MPLNITQYESLRNSQISYRGMAPLQRVSDDGRMERKGLKAARKRANLTQEAVAEAMGVSVPQISRWENGRDGIPSQRLQSLAETYRASLEELLGEDEVEQLPIVMVEQLPTTVGAGGGGLGVGDYRSVPVARSLVEFDLKVLPDDLLSVEVEGDSMVPEFFPGDQLLVNKRKTSLAQPGAFCLWDGDGYVIKYLEKVYDSDPQLIRVMSRNERYRPVERLADEVRIMGRVVWVGRRVG
ncbi:XRE family transcriptional regulator [Sphingobium cupriresistens]|uniref:XRE family transcriptional regulator n=1 Tax=Sphingobium cupriresistens TaxID=1132417 RepID=UPI003BADFE4E